MMLYIFGPPIGIPIYDITRVIVLNIILTTICDTPVVVDRDDTVLLILNIAPIEVNREIHAAYLYLNNNAIIPLINDRICR